MKRTKKFWIKERYNPQLGTYYVCYGQLSKIKARQLAVTLYGENIMHSFDAEEQYKAEIKALKKDGKRVQE